MKSDSQTQLDRIYGSLSEEARREMLSFLAGLMIKPTINPEYKNLRAPFNNRFYDIFFGSKLTSVQGYNVSKERELLDLFIQQVNNEYKTSYEGDSPFIETAFTGAMKTRQVNADKVVQKAYEEFHKDKIAERLPNAITSLMQRAEPQTAKNAVQDHTIDLLLVSINEYLRDHNQAEVGPDSLALMDVTLGPISNAIAAELANPNEQSGNIIYQKSQEIIAMGLGLGVVIEKLRTREPIKEIDKYRKLAINLLASKFPIAADETEAGIGDIQKQQLVKEYLSPRVLQGFSLQQAYNFLDDFGKECQTLQTGDQRSELFREKLNRVNLIYDNFKEMVLARSNINPVDIDNEAFFKTLCNNDSEEIYKLKKALLENNSSAIAKGAGREATTEEVTNWFNVAKKNEAYQNLVAQCAEIYEENLQVELNPSRLVSTEEEDLAGAIELQVIDPREARLAKLQGAFISGEINTFLNNLKDPEIREFYIEKRNEHAEILANLEGEIDIEQQQKLFLMDWNEILNDFEKIEQAAKPLIQDPKALLKLKLDYLKYYFAPIRENEPQRSVDNFLETGLRKLRVERKFTDFFKDETLQGPYKKFNDVVTQIRRALELPRTVHNVVAIERHLKEIWQQNVIVEFNRIIKENKTQPINKTNILDEVMEKKQDNFIAEIQKELNGPEGSGVEKFLDIKDSNNRPLISARKHHDLQKLHEFFVMAKNQQEVLSQNVFRMSGESIKTLEKNIRHNPVLRKEIIGLMDKLEIAWEQKRDAINNMGIRELVFKGNELISNNQGNEDKEFTTALRDAKRLLDECITKLPFDKRAPQSVLDKELPKIELTADQKHQVGKLRKEIQKISEKAPNFEFNNALTDIVKRSEQVSHQALAKLGKVVSKLRKFFGTEDKENEPAAASNKRKSQEKAK